MYQSPGPGSHASMQTRLAVWYRSLPFATAQIFNICVGVYVLCILTGYDDYRHFCTSPFNILRMYQVYRAFTAIFFHVGILHIAFNMMSFVPLGSSLERSVGTVKMLYLVLLFAAFGATMHTILGYLASLTAYSMEMYHCAVGFSGVIFGLIVVDTTQSNVTERSIMGFFTVPAKYYPFALLVFIQVLMPQVSFLGHLSGLLAGVAYTRGLLNWVIPDSSTLRSLEGSRSLRALAGWSSFIGADTGGSGGALPGSARAPSSQDSSLRLNIDRIGRFLPSFRSQVPFSGQGHTLGGAPAAGGGGGSGERVAPIPTFARLPVRAGADKGQVGGVVEGAGRAGGPGSAAEAGPGAAAAAPAALPARPKGPAQVTAELPDGAELADQPESSSGARAQPPVKPEALKALTDMGFAKVKLECA